MKLRNLADFNKCERIANDAFAADFEKGAEEK